MTTAATGPRRFVERRTATLLVFLQRAPRWVLLVAPAAVFFAGLALSGWGGAALLLLLAVFLGWVAFLSWPSVGASGKVLRVIALAVLVAVALGRPLLA